MSKKDSRLEDLLIARLDKLEDKVDKIVPEMAVLVENNKTSSKMHSSVAGALALFLSIFINKFQSH